MNQSFQAISEEGWQACGLFFGRGSSHSFLFAFLHQPLRKARKRDAEGDRSKQIEEDSDCEAQFQEDLELMVFLKVYHRSMPKASHQ